ncbi:MAG: hypothetical protein ACON4U_21195 [Myxococcota bacterium]
MTYIEPTVETLLQQFKSHANSADYPWLYRFDGGQYKTRLHVSCLIHGDETGSLPAVIKVIQKLKNKEIQFGGRLCISLGNPEAARKAVRYLESDLNRVFLDTNLQTHEARRARTLMPIFNQADILLDLHQTILKTQNPFYIFPKSTKSLLWAQAMRLTRAFIDATPASENTTRCADEYFWYQNKPAITLELSQKGLNAHAEDLSLTAIRRAIGIIEQQHLGQSLESIAAQSPALHLYHTVYRHPFDREACILKPNLHNFMSVEAGERLNAPEFAEIIAPITGEILFPKYLSKHQLNGETAPPKELFRIIQRA